MMSKRSVITVLALALLLGGTVMSMRQMALARSEISHRLGASVAMQMQINTDPMPTKSRHFGLVRGPLSYSFLATVLVLDRDESTLSVRTPIRVFTSNNSVAHLLPGQVISARGLLKQSKEARVAGIFLIKSEFRIHSRASRWARALGAIRDGLRRESNQSDAGALIPGMVLGDTSLQSESFRDAMKRSGLTHLVAVSGANFAIVSVFLLWCMQWIFGSLRLRLIFTAIALGSFVALVRPSPSVLRAAAMASVVLCAKGIGKRADPIAALGFAMAAVVIGDPWQARDPGFALSVLATAGLLLVSPRIAAALSSWLPKSIAHSLSVPIAAVVMCAPVLVALSGYLGLMTIVANLLAAPMVAPITIVGFIAALLSPVLPHVSSFLLSLIHLPAIWIAGVARWAAHFPVLQIGHGLFGFTFITVAVLLALRTRRVFLALFLVLALSITWLNRWPGGEWELANCDVGQGDSLVINLGEHRAIAIDAGPDPQLEDRCLSALGIRVVELLVLTHFHADHVEGVSGLLRGRSVNNLWVGNGSDPPQERARVLGLLQNVPRLQASKGMAVSMASFRGPVAIKVLWPESGAPECQERQGDGTSINNTSVVLEVRTRDFSLFAPGDVEPCPQSQIREGQVDIYKVSHHGSAHQDFALMNALSPTLALISVGAGNSYGHPAPRTIAALARLRSRIYRTDRVGSVAIRARDHNFIVRTSAGTWWKRVRLG